MYGNVKKYTIFVIFLFFLFYMNKLLKFKLLSLYILLFAALSAQIPAGYYDAASGKKDAELKTALFKIINAHTQLEYYSSSTSFRQTDWNPNGYFWDMYSNIHRSSWSGLNREHSLPKSWFGISSGQENSIPMGTDLHNLYPSDATANTAKSNYPLGEVTGTPTFDNDVVKVGTNGFAGYSGQVFEPADEYKGDFARDYMYMVTCYEDQSSRWTSTGTASMLIRNSTYPVFKTYAINLLMKWSREDPVSEKEIDRNNAVYSLQGNRNPFIDHPLLAEYIWGEYTGIAWDETDTNPDVNDFTVTYHASNKTLTNSLAASTEAVYKIYSIDGVLRVSGTTTGGDAINLQQLSSGVYIILAYYGSKRANAKFIVL